jgi:hypothetical protein
MMANKRSPGQRKEYFSCRTPDTFRKECVSVFSVPKLLSLFLFRSISLFLLVFPLSLCLFVSSLVFSFSLSHLSLFLSVHYAPSYFLTFSMSHSLCLSPAPGPFISFTLFFDLLTFSLLTVSLSLVAAFYLSVCLFLAVSRSLLACSPSLLTLGRFSLCLFTHGVQDGSRRQKRGCAVSAVGWEASNVVGL